MSSILTDSHTALWHDLVREAEQQGRAPLDEELESYLVFMLMRHVRDGGLGDHVLALDYLASLQDQGRLRGEALRDVGDRCLLIAGLYPEQARQRLVSLDYFMSMGIHAYAEVASATRAALAALYERLSSAFGRLVRVLVELRRLPSGLDPLDALNRYDLARADPANDFPGAVVLAPASSRRH